MCHQWRSWSTPPMSSTSSLSVFSPVQVSVFPPLWMWDPPLCRGVFFSPLYEFFPSLYRGVFFSPVHVRSSPVQGRVFSSPVHVRYVSLDFFLKWNSLLCSSPLLNSPPVALFQKNGQRSSKKASHHRPRPRHHLPWLRATALPLSRPLSRTRDRPQNRGADSKTPARKWAERPTQVWSAVDIWSVWFSGATCEGAPGPVWGQQVTPQQPAGGVHQAGVCQPQLHQVLRPHLAFRHRLPAKHGIIHTNLFSVDHMKARVCISRWTIQAPSTLLLRSHAAGNKDSWHLILRRVFDKQGFAIFHLVYINKDLQRIISHDKDWKYFIFRCSTQVSCVDGAGHSHGEASIPELSREHQFLCSLFFSETYLWKLL